MSLFSNQNTAQNKPSLFSTPAAPTAPGTTTTGGLFGSLNSKPATSSLFGTAPTQPQQQQQPQTTSGLFGGLGAATQPQQQQTTSTGLFGGLGSTSQPQQAQQSGGLFGGLNPTTQSQQPAGTSLFGGLGASTTAQQPQAQPLAQSSLLGSTQIASQSQQTGPNGAYFDAILEKSRKRVHGLEEGAGDNLPSLQLGLGDLRQRIKRLGPGIQERGVDGRAHYLLAASGVDPGAAVRDIGFFNAQSTRLERTAPQEPTDTDVEGYLAKLQTQTTLTMISDGLARSVRDFDAFLEDNVTMEWDAQRKRIYQHFGIKPREESSAGEKSSFAASAAESKGAFGRSRRTKGSPAAGSRVAGGLGVSTFGKSSMQKSVIGTPLPLGTGRQSLFTDVEKKVESNAITAPDPSDRFLREKQGKFMEKVQNLNVARLRKAPYPLLHEFASIAGQPGEQHSQELVKAYRALIEIIGENPTVESFSDAAAVKERQLADGYLDEIQNSQKRVKIKKMILRGSTRYLEKQFYEEMETLVAKNPREANLGGVPNVISKVKAYVRIRAARKDLAPDNTTLQMLGDDYVWALIFYLLRSGHVQEAAEYVSSNAVAFRAIDRSFAAYITDYNNSAERRLRRELQDRINAEYNQRLRIAPEHSIDPFRMACYKVIGRCDLAKRNLDGLNQSMDDFTWLQFNLAREVNRVEEIASEVYGLADVQTTIQEIGNRYFSKGSADSNGQYGVFFYLQVLAGMFEQAIEYLYPFQYVDAVHFAIALDYYGLLRVSNPSVVDSEFMSYTTKGHPQISFGRMLGYYTRDFRAANVGAAVDYLCLICLNQDLPGDLGHKQASLCHEALRELVLESREYALLLGDIRSDGVRIKGAVEERMGLIGLEDTDDFMRTVTIQAASIADDNGRTTDAVLLYHLAGEYDNVIAVITRALSEAVAVPIGQDQLKLQPLKPRTTDASKHDAGTSLSLTSVDDPVVLAKNMTDLYKTNMMFLDKIKPENKDACGVLLRMSSAKVKVEEGRWTEALDIIVTLDILPLEARGNPSVIRSYATKFSALSQPVANNVPNLLMWTILCCNRQRSILTNGQFGGNEGTRRMMIEDLKQKNLDLTTYTSQLRYRFPAHVHEALARAQSE
ncbi:Nup93/Nic96-domain-containing protein [Xylogone sp. PMI_703]|nr:Nup93/Nic96-domain-containing protein [Xylogone sp. PMI_703]